MPKRSSKASWLMSVLSSCARKASAIPYSFMVFSFSIVGWFNMFFLSVVLGLPQQRCGQVVIMGTAHIFMFRARPLRLRRESGLSVQPAFQNRLQGLVRAGLQLQGTLAGSFQPWIGVGLAQAHDSQTSPVAHLGMGPTFQNR